MSSEKFQQLPIPSRTKHDAIFNASYITGIPSQLKTWNSQRAVLVISKPLANQHPVIENPQSKLGDYLVDTKYGVGAHSPYADVTDIAHRLHKHNADTLISIGSSSYSYACKITRIMHS